MSTIDREQFVEDFFVATQAIQRLWKEQFYLRLGSERLTFGQMGVLMHVSENQPVNSKQIVEAMHSSKSSVAQLLDSLDQLGYITRHHDPSDRRVIYVSLSKQGSDKVASLHTKRREFFSHMTEGLNKQDLIAMTDIHNKMLQSFKTSKDITEEIKV
jgi:DNA-binding MarR family transcriptional regulator